MAVGCGRRSELAEGWRRLGYELGFGVGISRGFATLGRIGFEGRYDYGAIGTVTNLAARFSARANAGQILVSQRVMAGAGDVAVAREVGPISFEGSPNRWSPTRSWA